MNLSLIYRRSIFATAFGLLLLTAPMAVIASPFISNPSDDIRVEIFGSSQGGTAKSWVTNNEAIRFDDPFLIGFLSDCCVTPILYPTNKAFFAKFKLTDSSGNAVPATDVGRAWGDDLKHFPQKPMRSGPNVMEWTSAVAPTDREGTGVASFPAAGSLFTIDTPGIYRLTVEIHFMKQVFDGNSPGGSDWKHVKIGPFSFPIEKPGASEQEPPGFLPAKSKEGLVAFSDPVEDVYAGIGVSEKEGKTNLKIGDALSSSKELRLNLFSDAIETRFLIPGDERNFVKFTLFDPNGKEVPKTEIGQIWGSEMDSRKFLDHPSLVEPTLPAPERLFEMSAPGIYEMTVEAHVMRWTLLYGDKYHWEMIQLPPFKVKIEKRR